MLSKNIILEQNPLYHLHILAKRKKKDININIERKIETVNTTFISTQWDRDKNEKNLLFKWTDRDFFLRYKLSEIIKAYFYT